MVQPHSQLDESLGIRYAILPGDPARVSRIAAQLDNPEEITFNREYRSLKGAYKGVPILAMSTGMGGASMAIAVEELKNIGITHNRESEDGVLKLEFYGEAALTEASGLLTAEGYALRTRS